MVLDLHVFECFHIHHDFYVLVSFCFSGPPHSVKCSEVRKTSLVLQWRPPIHSGRTPVTGYFVDLKEASAKDDQWRGLNEAAIKNTYLRVRVCSYFENHFFVLKKKCSSNGINFKISKIEYNISALVCFIYWAPGKFPFGSGWGWGQFLMLKAIWFYLT